MSENKLTLEQTTDLANQIQTLKMIIHTIDLEVLDGSIEGFKDQINFQNNMVMFNPSYSLNSQKALEKQYEALKHLRSFINCLKEVDELKNKAKTNPFKDIVDRFV